MPDLQPEGIKLRLRAAPHAVFGMADGTRYMADAQGIIVAAKEHFGALMRAGCAKA